MRLSLAVLLITWSASVHADEPLNPRTNPDAAQKSKPAWEWTLDERLARRFDAQRIAKHAAEESTAAHPVSVNLRLFGIVDGSETPELLMPNELFSSLLSGLEGSERFREISRETLQDGIRAFGWDDGTFWRELESLSATYLTLSQKLRNLPTPVNATGAAGAALQEDTDRLDRDVCAARIAALGNARRHFGRATFDRFLYTVVAPTLRVGSDNPSESSAKHLLFLEGGCK
jgi:hypothetical protein